MSLNITNPYGPNTTVLLAGKCNAKCDFCFWNAKLGKEDVEDYLDKVFASLKKLPEEFRVLSISGGEPSLSPYINAFLIRLSKFRRVERQFDRVVFTTNGTGLRTNETLIPLLGCAVDHINISRHGIGTHSNRAIFKTDSIPTDVQLQMLIERIHTETEMDVTFNCVVPEDVEIEYCEAFVQYAKNRGADAVSFRKEASEVSPTKAEKHFRKKFGVDHETKCPVCRGMSQSWHGFPVRWKGSVTEPSIETGGVYEAVIHADGAVYTDWNKKVPFPFPKTGKEAVAKKVLKHTPVHVVHGVKQEARKVLPTYTGSGCGIGSTARC